MAGSPYQLYGGATRPDALNFNAAFAEAMNALYAAAPPEVQSELGLTSGYRSPEVQQALWDKSDKTGHTVARPGRSKHQHGTAADLYGFGLGDGPSVSQATKDWVHQNAAAHGLAFPMNYEPWHVQLANGTAPAAEGTTAGTMASAFDPRAAVLAQLEHNPWKAITDVGPKRDGLVGEGSAGGGLAAAPDADPSIPPIESANANVAPLEPSAPLPGQSPLKKLGQLAQLFKVAPRIGAAAEGQALPIRRA
jgi:hypothetical protein